MANTQQREVILSVLKEAARPLTREEILSLGRQQSAAGFGHRQSCDS